MNAMQLLDQILEPVADAISPEFARRIADLRADNSVQELIDLLAAKSTEGSLTEEESSEYKSYVDAIDLISVLQSKAQRSLDAAQKQPPKVI